jgi:hypothetical protein
MGKSFDNIEIGNVFLNSTPIVHKLRTWTYKWDCIKLKSFCTAKEKISKAKRQPTKWEEIFTSYSLNKELATRIYKEFKKLNTKGTNNPNNKGEMNWTVSSQKKYK